MVLIAPGVYRFKVWLKNSGTPQNPIFFTAKDPCDRPIFDHTGADSSTFPGSYTAGDKDRHIWRVDADDVIIDGLVFRGARSTASEAASGVRVMTNRTATVRHSKFEDNDDGLFASNCTALTAEFNEFVHNGVASTDQSHNMYVSGETLVCRYNWFHDNTGAGQNLHSRFTTAYIEGNLFERAYGYEGDVMPNRSNSTQTMYFRGNVVVTASAQSGTVKVWVLATDSGMTGGHFILHMTGNTFIANDVAATNGIVQLANGTDSSGNGLSDIEVEFSNNLVAGPQVRSFFIINAPSTSNYTITGKGNWALTGAKVSPLSAADQSFGGDPLFVDPASGDYRLQPLSPCVGKADATTLEQATREYWKNEVLARGYRERTANLDVGAYETTTTGAAQFW